MGRRGKLLKYKRALRLNKCIVWTQFEPCLEQTDCENTLVRQLGKNFFFKDIIYFYERERECVQGLGGAEGEGEGEGENSKQALH